MVAARVCATAHGVFELEINGQGVGDEALLPGRSPYGSSEVAHPGFMRSTTGPRPSGSVGIASLRTAPLTPGRWRRARCLSRILISEALQGASPRGLHRAPRATQEEEVVRLRQAALCRPKSPNRPRRQRQTRYSIVAPAD